MREVETATTPGTQDVVRRVRGGSDLVSSLAERVKRSTLDTRLALAVGIVALVASLFRLGAPSLWMDEAFSVALSRAPWSTLADAFWSGGEPNMLVYYSLLHIWLQLTGALGLPASEFVVRLPSVLFAALSAPVVFLLGRRLFGRVAGLAAALVFLFNPLQLEYAQQTRSYALQVLLVCLTWYALAMAITMPTATEIEARLMSRTRWWMVFAGFSVLAIYAHLFTLLILLAQVTAFALLLLVPNPWRQAARTNLWALGFSVIGIFVAISPLLYASRSGSKTGWLPAPDLGAVASHVSGILLHGSGKLLVLVGIALLVVVALGVAGWLAWRRGALRRGALQAWLGELTKRMDVFGAAEKRPQPLLPVLILLLAWLCVPVIVSFVVSLGPLRLFSIRYLVVVVPAVALLVGGAISLIRWRAGQLAAAALVACLALALAPTYYARAQVEDWRGPTRWLETVYQPGDGLVCYNNVQGCQLAVEYYLVTDHSRASFAPDSPGVTDLSRFGTGDPFANYTEALDPHALSEFGASHARLFFIEGRISGAQDAARVLAVQRWFDCRYSYVAGEATAVVTIRLYDTASPRAACALPPSA